MGRLAGRTEEIRALRRIFANSESSLTHLTGPAGVGKTTLLAHVSGDRPSLHLHCPPLPSPLQLQQMAARVETGLPVAESEEEAGPAEIDDWADFFDAVAARRGDAGEPFILVLDDAHRLDESRARFAGPLDDLLRRTRREGRPIHVVMAGPGGALPDLPRRPTVEVGETLRVGPLSFHEARRLLPGERVEELLCAFAVFGGTPERLVLLEPEATLGSNLKRLVFRPGAPFGRHGLDLVERSVQVPSRYMAILSRLAHGEADWSEVHDGVPDLTRSGQLAPYLSRLEELGIVGVGRSLDAGPGGRRRRYRILDPFLRFWFRFVLPAREALSRGEGEDLYSSVAAELPAYTPSVLTEVCREFMRRGGEEVVEGDARECGGLWGAGYDLPVSGLLTTGAAFYGSSVWDEDFSDDAVADLDRQVRETRYGFGRERRYRILFHRHEPPVEVARIAARRENVVLVPFERVVEGAVVE